MSSYTIIVSLRSQQEYKKLPRLVQQRIKDKLELAREDTFHFFERLKGRADYKLRIGDYRVIADLNVNAQRIEITEVGHRKNIYKK